tara:strand:+ start:366 stop:587 length:222 start_codon:yes stop_codon:yes gene_type:complete
MKKLFSILSIALFSITTSSYAVDSNNATNKVGNVEVRYPDCWAAADAAEEETCGDVGCNFELWEAVYTACTGD